METQIVETPHLEAVLNGKKCSDLKRHLRVIALVMKFVSNLKVRLEQKDGELGRLTVQEIVVAKFTLIKTAQTNLKSRSDYQQLVLQLGLVEKDGVLRCKGMPGNADLGLEAKDPVILPTEHWLTPLIIRTSHQRAHQCGLRATLTELRSRFWVPRGR